MSELTELTNVPMEVYCEQRNAVENEEPPSVVSETPVKRKGQGGRPKGAMNKSKKTKQVPKKKKPLVLDTPKASTSAVVVKTAPVTPDSESGDEVEEQPFAEDFCPVDDTTEEVVAPADGWTPDAIRTLCELHMPMLVEYNGYLYPKKRLYWKSLGERMGARGFAHARFTQSKDVSKKWRQLYTRFKQVKDNAGATGRGTMKFRHYDMMAEVATHCASSILSDPTICESTGDFDETTSIPRRDRTKQTGKEKEKSPKEQHYDAVRAEQKRFNEELLTIQREALELEKLRTRAAMKVMGLTE